jgi:hypothetical protein
MLNDPIKFHVDASSKVIKQATKNTDLIKIELRNIYKPEEKAVVRLEAQSNGHAIKEKWLKAFPRYEKIRLFTIGREIKDFDPLQNFVIFKEMVIQVFAK